MLNIVHAATTIFCMWSARGSEIIGTLSDDLPSETLAYIPTLKTASDVAQSYSQDNWSNYEETAKQALEPSNHVFVRYGDFFCSMKRSLSYLQVL